MRILADENFPLVAVEALQQQGHDVLWIRTDTPGVIAFPKPVKYSLPLHRVHLARQGKGAMHCALTECTLPDPEPL